MGNDELLNYISMFREKAEQGKLVIFVGAGVSCNVDGMPSWNALIQNMAKAIDYSRCDTCRHRLESCENTCLLKDDFSTDELLKVPQHVFNKDQELYYRILNESIPAVTADAPLSSAIFDINPAHIITTNYDQLLESSKNIFCEQYQVIVYDKDLLNADKGKYIIKMHGDLSDASSIVLKEQDYLDYSQKHVLIELFIKSLLTDHIVLFLGYSLNDYNIKLILSWLNYMRSQNGAFDVDRRVGYLILDQEIVDDTQLSYFSSNNIEVININSMPLIQEIPADLSNEIGKRLYSFLRVIANPALEENLSTIENAVRFMSRFSFVSYEQILKLLYVKRYEVTDRELRLFSENDYARLIAFMESGDEGATDLRQLFLNAGIVSIQCIHEHKVMRFRIGELSDNALLKSEIFNLYILNKYDEIKALLNSEHIDLEAKDLSALVRSYNVKQLNTGVQEVTFLAECFKNLCHSIVTAKTYGLLQSSFSALSNIVLLLNLVVLDENSKEIIAASVEALLSDKIIAPIFFSIGWPDFRQSLRELSKLCSLLAFPHNFEFVHQIVGGEKFFEYAVNVHFNSLRHLIEQFISKDEATTDKIQAIIDTTEDFHKKVILLRLFYQQITGDTVQQKYKYILSDNFAQLPIEAIYDFIFSGWLTPDQNSIKEFLNGVIELSRKEVTGVHSYPDPVESRLECVYLLYINDMISDISALKELSEGRPHLQFLLDSESFDYSQVDFSNYMWENFARHEKYMSCFIAHKDAIIPIIQNRIKSEEASETEKRILYGFLLSGNEIWKI